MKQGQNYVLSEEESGFFRDMFFMEKPFLTNGLRDVFDGIFSHLIRRYTNVDIDMNIRYNGGFSRFVMKNEGTKVMNSGLGCCPF